MVACRHAIAQHAVNMYYGEMYGYAHYLQTISLLPKNVQFFGMMLSVNIGHG